jgi:hypothetical protein
MIKKLEIPVFHGWLYLYQGVPFDEVATRHNMVVEKDGADAMSGSDIDKNEVTAYIIAVEDNVSASSVAHEALHVVNYMMKDRDMVPDLNNDEWQCYLLGWIVRQCHKYMKVLP